MMVYTFGGTVTQTFGVGGPASSVTVLLAIAIGGSVAGMIASAVGQGDKVSIIRALTTLSCIGVLVAAVAKALGFMGMSW